MYLAFFTIVMHRSVMIYRRVDEMENIDCKNSYRSYISNVDRGHVVLCKKKDLKVIQLFSKILNYTKYAKGLKMSTKYENTCIKALCPLLIRRPTARK